MDLNWKAKWKQNNSRYKFYIGIYLSVLISVVSIPTSLVSIEMLLVPLTVNSVDGTDTDNSLGAATLTVLLQIILSLFELFLCWKPHNWKRWVATQNEGSNQNELVSVTRLIAIYFDCISFDSNFFNFSWIHAHKHYSLNSQKSNSTVCRFMHLRACVPSPHSCDSNQTIELSANHSIVFISQMSHKFISIFFWIFAHVPVPKLSNTQLYQFLHQMLKAHRRVQANSNWKKDFCTISNRFKQHETKIK